MKCIGLFTSAMILLNVRTAHAIDPEAFSWPVPATQPAKLVYSHWPDWLLTPSISQDLPAFQAYAARLQAIFQFDKPFIDNSPPESLGDVGLHYLRRPHSRGQHYLLSNPTTRPIDQWVPLATPAAAAVLMDPLTEDHVGTAALRHRADTTQPEVYLQLAPGQILLLRTFTHIQPSGPEWQYLVPMHTPIALNCTWNVGGWYETDFDLPSLRCWDFRLNLGQVTVPARVKLNGKTLPEIWRPPYFLQIGKYLNEGSNHLQIEVPKQKMGPLQLIPMMRIDPYPENH